METTVDRKPSYAELEAEVERLRFELANLKRLIFGQKRERFVPAERDSQLDFLVSTADLITRSQPQTVQITYTRPKGGKKPPSRQILPAYLPRIDILIEPEEDVTALKKIGEEITEELDYEPGKLYVNRYIRPKYAPPGTKEWSSVFCPPVPLKRGWPVPGFWLT